MFLICYSLSLLTSSSCGAMGTQKGWRACQGCQLEGSGLGVSKSTFCPCHNTTVVTSKYRHKESSL